MLDGIGLSLSFEKNISKKDGRVENTFLRISAKNDQKKDPPGRFSDRKSQISAPQTGEPPPSPPRATALAACPECIFS